MGKDKETAGGSSQYRELTASQAEFNRVLRFASRHVTAAVRAMEGDPVKCQSHIVAVFNGWDVSCVMLYEHIARRSASPLPKRLEPGTILVLGLSYHEVLPLLAQRYDLSQFKGKPLEPKQVRVLLFAGGEVAFRHVGLHDVSIPPGLMSGRGGVA